MRRIGLILLVPWGLPSCAVLPPRQDPPVDVPHVFHAASPPPGGTQKWNPVWWLGNADDPEPPDWYRPYSPFRGVQWQLRNPFHNFTFYVIGVKDSDFIRWGNEPEGVFRREGGWNWCVIQKGWLRLPFVSYEGERMKFYALWREHGNFGLKLNFKDPAKATEIAESQSPPPMPQDRRGDANPPR